MKTYETLASEILAKKHMKTLEKGIAKHIKHPDKTYNVCVKHMQHQNKHTCNVMSEKVDETFGTGACNIHVQLLQHVKHSDLFFVTLI
jgi:hypothetical protein